MTLLLVLGCPVPLEWARVDPPRPGGIEALALEDFERDLWLLGQPGRDEAISRRWQEMGLTPEGPCGVRAGADGLVLIEADDDLSVAMAISLAKTFDNSSPARSLWFCAGPHTLPEEPVGTITLVGPSRKATELLQATASAHAELSALLD